MLFENVYALGYSIIMLAAVFIVGYVIVRAPFIRRFYLPTALVAGLILLLLSPQVAQNFYPNFHLSKAFYDIWGGVPKILINIVFACLLLTKPLMPIKKIWKTAGPQVAFGQMLAWGQYFVAGILTLLVLVPVFKMPEISASLIEVSFEGGHGTVAGLSSVFSKFNFQQGKDIANGLATASLISSLIIGLILISWGKKSGHLKAGGVTKIARNKVYYHKIIHDLHSKGVHLRQQITIKRFLGHSILVALSVGVGFLLHEALLFFEKITWGNLGVNFVGYLPVFTFCMLGGVIVGEVTRRHGYKMSRELIGLIDAIALSGLIMTAIGTMNLSFLGSNLEVFVMLFLAGVLWLTFSFIFLARRIFPEYWFQNAIVSFGQSMGMTATGLLFAQMVDEKNETNAVESFGYKQLLFEPLMGGGIVTALSMPLIAILGLPIFTAICGFVTFGWLILGVVYFRRRK